MCVVSQLKNIYTQGIIVIHNNKCYNTTAGKTLIMYHARYEKQPKTTPFWGPKKVETYSPSKAVARNLGEEVPLDRPCHNKTWISDQGEQPLSSQERWQKDIANVNVDGRKAYQLSAARTKSSKLLDFNFRFLHSRLAMIVFWKKK